MKWAKAQKGGRRRSGSEVGRSGLPRGLIELSAMGSSRKQRKVVAAHRPLVGKQQYDPLRRSTRGTILGIYNVQNVMRMGLSCSSQGVRGTSWALVLASEPLLDEDERDKDVVNDHTAVRFNFQDPVLYVRWLAMRGSMKFGDKNFFLTRPFDELTNPKRSVSVHGTVQTRSRSL